MKEALFHVKAREAIKTFPSEIKLSLGKAIWELQRGAHIGMPFSRPMPTITTGVEELRVKDRSGIYRAFYYTKSERGIIVFHAFAKKTQKTPILEIELAKRRLKEMLREKE